MGFSERHSPYPIALTILTLIIRCIHSKDNKSACGQYLQTKISVSRHKSTFDQRSNRSTLRSYIAQSHC